MRSSPPILRSLLQYAACFCLLLGTHPFAHGQAAATGGLNGRVFNPRTSEYVRNAEVRIEGMDVVVVTGAGGSFRVPNLAPGTVSVTVTYAGYPDILTTATIQSGQFTELELELDAEGTTTGEDGTVNLAAFVVSAEAEGNAKAIMEQRNSMSLGRSIASDVFGDVTEGNVGEFLKYLPGIEIEMVEADNRGPRLGGMAPEYTGVSVDGMQSASADGFVTWGGTENSSGGGSSSRSFGFEQVSINSIESIEISRITPANLDANAPAGTINMKTKRAFDRRGRLVTWSAGVGLNSEEFTLSKTNGPGDEHGRKVKPILSFNYADTFMDNRLGILFGYSHSNLYNEQYRVQPIYQRTPTAIDPRPQVLTGFNIKDGPKWTERNTFTTTIDFRATPSLILSLGVIYNTYEADIFNRMVQIRAANNNANSRHFAAGDGITTFGTNPDNLAPANQRWIRPVGGYINKQTKGATIVPKLEYRRGDLLVEMSLSHSYSKNTYDSLRKGWAGGARRDYNGIEFTATRPSESASAWTIVQTGGPDWSDLGNSTGPNTIGNDVRYVYNEVNIAKLDLTYNLALRYPTVIYAGAKYQETISRANRRSGINNFIYNGGSLADFPSTFDFHPKGLGVNFVSLNGGRGPEYVDREALGKLYQESPELFTRTFNANQYHTSMFGEVRDLTEDIPALYTMARTTFGRFQAQAGLRWEETNVSSMQFDPLPASEVSAAGFPTNTSTGLATTVDGLDYQYRSRPMVNRTGDYDRLFPSISGKYRLGENFIFDIGYGTAIRRPQLGLLSGLFTVNEESEVIRTTNPGLLPEYSDRFAASLAYYFGGSSNLTLTLTDTNIENFFIQQEFTAPEFGITDPDLQDYRVITTVNGTDGQKFRSLELSYRQTLRTLPAFLDSATVFGTYTRTYSDRRAPGATPHTMTGGFDVSIKRVTFGLKGVWVDDAEWTGVVGRYRESNLKLDGSLNIRLTGRLTAFVQARNITRVNHTIWEEIGGNRPVIWREENYGANYVFGIRGRF